MSARERPAPPKGFAGGKALAAFKLLRDARARQGRAALRATPPRREELRRIAAARSGDRKALEALLRDLSAPALRFASNFCRHPEDAEEVMQDVLVSLATHLDSYRGDASLATWAYTVARNNCVRRRRKRAGAPEPPESLDSAAGASAGQLRDPADTPEASLERAELRRAVNEAIQALPLAQREVLVLRDVEGLAASEVAAILGLGERAVKSRLHRARLAVRASLAPRLGRPGPRLRPRPSCPDTARLISRYLEGDLNAGVCSRMESHVLGCPACQGACDSLREALTQCAGMGTAPVPVPLRQLIARSIRAVARREASPRRA